MAEEKLRMIKDCDIMLMIPGRIDSYGSKTIAPSTDERAEQFIETMKKQISIEMGESAQDAYERIDLGPAYLRFEHDEDMPRQDDIFFQAILMLLVHKDTKLSVLELYIPDCDDGVQLLECFRNDAMFIKRDGESYISEAALLKELDMNPYGMKRSAVFAYGKPSDKEIIHVLANELTPHDGDVRGVLAEKVKSGDRSQYSKTRTYASNATLVEVWDDPVKESPAERIWYQCSEIYFIELLLMRDASSANISARLWKLRRDISSKDAAAARNELERIDNALAQSTQLYDPTLCKWPTVLESMRLLQQDFGIDGIESRFSSNRELLEKMLGRLSEAERKHEEDIKNRFLLVITAMSTISTLNSGLTDLSTPTQVYTLSAVLVIFSYAAYRLMVKKGSKKGGSK